VKLKVPAAVGVPDRTPVAVTKVMPVGIVPVLERTRAPVPPADVTVWE
jgi:hypothetical protein